MAEYVTLCERLHNLSDPRDQDHVVYTLPEVLFIVYASILSDYTAWEDMEAFAKHNAAWFRQFFPYQFGFPSYPAKGMFAHRLGSVHADVCRLDE